MKNKIWFERKVVRCQNKRIEKHHRKIKFDSKGYKHLKDIVIFLMRVFILLKEKKIKLLSLLGRLKSKNRLNHQKVIFDRFNF